MKNWASPRRERLICLIKEKIGHIAREKGDGPFLFCDIALENKG
jgi:oxalate decarboxylase/phosphoglucose isomerase-like protein (cupin superfamily)